MPFTTEELNTLLADYVKVSEHQELLDAYNMLDAEHTDIKAKHDKLATDHGTATKRAQDLEKSVRGRALKDAYGKLAKGKVKDEYADDVFDLLKLEADADEPDEKAIAKALDGFLEKRAHYAHVEGDGEAGAGAEKTRPKTLPAGEGASRGGSPHGDEPGTFKATKSQLRDGKFTFENQDKISAAADAGLLVVIDA